MSRLKDDQIQPRRHCQGFYAWGGGALADDLDQTAMQGGGKFAFHADALVCRAMGSLGDHPDRVLSLADGLSGCLEDSGGSGHCDGGRGAEGDPIFVMPGRGWAQQDRAVRQRRGGFPQMGLRALDHGGHQRRGGRHIGAILGGCVARERGQHGHVLFGQAKLAHQKNGLWRDDGGRTHQCVSLPFHPKCCREKSSGLAIGSLGTFAE